MSPRYAKVFKQRGSFQAICADFPGIHLSLKKSSISIVKSLKTEKDTLDVIPPWNFATRVNFQFCAHVRQHQASTSHMAICVYHLNLSNYVISNELFSPGHAGLLSFCKVLCRSVKGVWRESVHVSDVYNHLVKL